MFGLALSGKTYGEYRFALGANWPTHYRSVEDEIGVEAGIDREFLRKEFLGIYGGLKATLLSDLLEIDFRHLTGIWHRERNRVFYAGIPIEAALKYGIDRVKPYFGIGGQLDVKLFDYRLERTMQRCDGQVCRDGKFLHISMDYQRLVPRVFLAMGMEMQLEKRKFLIDFQARRDMAPYLIRSGRTRTTTGRLVGSLGIVI